MLNLQTMMVQKKSLKNGFFAGKTGSRKIQNKPFNDYPNLLTFPYFLTIAERGVVFKHSSGYSI